MTLAVRPAVLQGGIHYGLINDSSFDSHNPVTGNLVKGEISVTQPVYTLDASAT